jgi:hypothetical protein
MSDRFPANLGAPWKASACAPTMTNSTWWAISNPQNSSESGARSKVLPPEKLDGGHPLLRRTSPPVPERMILSSVLGERRQAHGATVQPELHARILALRLFPHDLAEDLQCPGNEPFLLQRRTLS